MNKARDPLELLFCLLGDSLQGSLEEWQELSLRARRYFERHPNLSSAQKVKWLLAQWLQRLGLDKNDYPHDLMLRTLLLHNYSWPELAQVFSMTVAQAKSKTFEVLLEEVDSACLFSRPTRDCARNDLYLIDKLVGLKWDHSLNLYSSYDFERHLTECERCKNLYSSAQNHINKIKISFVENQKQFQIEKIGRRDMGDSSFPLGDLGWSSVVTRAGSLFVGALLIFGAVLVMPNWQSLSDGFEKKWSQAQIYWAQRKKTEQTVEAPNDAQIASAEAVEPVEFEADFVAQKEEAPIATQQKSTTEVFVRKEPEPPPPATPTQTTTTRAFYRWGARAEDPDRIASLVLAMIKKQSAENAGELDFGAEYRGGRYFHFMVDKKDYESLLVDIKALPLTDFTDAAAESDRRIPAHRARVVLWIGPAR
jgi:hypothetical protein